VIDATGKKNALSFLSTKSKIRYLTIKNADATNVSVDKRSSLSVRDCTVKGGGKYGIVVDESSATNKYKFHGGRLDNFRKQIAGPVYFEKENQPEGQ